MNTSLAPIVLFVYDRPDHAKRVVEGLLQNPEAKDSILYVFADGPKDTASEAARKRIADTRDYIQTITGFKEVIIEASEKNKGLAASIIGGCTKILSLHGRIIVMEDDIVACPYYLNYMNTGLEKYKDDEKIWSLSGFTDTSVMIPHGDEDAYCINRFSCWGYATWKRCWDKAIWDIPTLQEMFKDKQLQADFDAWGGNDLSKMMLGLFAGSNGSWAIRYTFSSFLNKTFNIHTRESLVQNIGCDGSGTHSGKETFHIQMMDHKVVFPETIEFDPIRNEQMCKSHHRIPTTLKGKIGYVVKKSARLHRLCRKWGLCK